MSSSSSSSFVLAKDNLADKDKVHATEIRQSSLSIPFGQQLNYQSGDDDARNTDFNDLRLPGVDLNYKTAASDKTCMPCGHKFNARNLIVCIDGTSHQFGEKVSVGLANIRSGSRHFQRSEHKRNKIVQPYIKEG